ncbi:MAG: branched-chain amino acid ABC transporter permease [Candidatus Nezhaarchaeales archaeon]
MDGLTLPVEALFLVDLMSTFAPYLLVTLSLNLEYGYTGVPDFGKTLAVAGGAFLVGYLPGRLLMQLLGVGLGLSYVEHNAEIVTKINEFLRVNVPLSMAVLALTLALAMVVGAALGFLVSHPAIRLREISLAMVFLAAGEALVVIGHNYPELAGGTLGIGVPDVFAWAGEYRFPMVTAFMIAVVVAVFIYLYLLTKSPLGRLLRAVRDDENAALALGKDVTKVRIKVITLASAITALGGALYAIYTGSVIAAAYQKVSWTFWPWVMVILGGTANNVGVVLGTFVFVTVRKLIIFYKDAFAPYVPFDVVWLDMLLLGVALILILLYRPEGLIPEKPIKTVAVRRVTAALKLREPGIKG